MTYSINGVSLDNSAYGWRILADTRPHIAVSRELTIARHMGRDGGKLLNRTNDTAMLKFMMVADTNQWENLVALFSGGSLSITTTLKPGYVAEGILASMSDPEPFARSNKVMGDFIVEIPDGTWRGALSTSTAATGTAVLYPGLSAPVQDALVRVKGPVENPQIVDSSGAFISFKGTLTNTQYLRFESDSGRAWRTTSNAWSGGTEVSGLVDYGGPRGVFEITPTFPTPSNPASREGRLTLTAATTGEGHGFQVRGRPSFLF